MRANKRNQKKSGRKYRDNIISPESKKSKTSESKTEDELVVLPKPTTSKPIDFPKEDPKVRFSELESEEEFVSKPRQKPNQVLESDSDSDEASDDNERTLVSMSFKEGTMETIDKLTFLSQILIKKKQNIIGINIKRLKIGRRIHG